MPLPRDRPTSKLNATILSLVAWLDHFLLSATESLGCSDWIILAAHFDLSIHLAKGLFNSAKFGLISGSQSILGPVAICPIYADQQNIIPSILV